MKKLMSLSICKENLSARPRSPSIRRKNDGEGRKPRNRHDQPEHISETVESLTWNNLSARIIIISKVKVRISGRRSDLSIVGTVRIEEEQNYANSSYWVIKLARNKAPASWLEHNGSTSVNRRNPPTFKCQCECTGFSFKYKHKGS